MIYSPYPGHKCPGYTHPPLWREDKDYAIPKFAQFHKAAGTIMIFLKEI
jgi:hypothetical protein